MELDNTIVDLNNKNIVEGFIKDYSANHEPITVSFRELLYEIKKTDRYSHSIHPYPAKLLLHIPYFFLNNSYFSEKEDLVLDPFCGTGTVLLESVIAGRNALGADSNPLARLIAKVKTTNYNSLILKTWLDTIIENTKQIFDEDYPDVVNINYWFPNNSKMYLSRLLKVIKKIENEEIKNFFLVCLSNCVKKVSYADPRIAVPVKLNPNRFNEGSKQRKSISIRLKELESLDVIEKFRNICNDNINRVVNFSQVINKNIYSKVISKDARNLTESIDSTNKLCDNSVKMVLTSPPYAGAQKYIRSSSLNLGWLELVRSNDLQLLDEKNIGRENYKKNEIKQLVTGIIEADNLISEIHKINPRRSYIVSNYLLEMQDALKEAVRVLKQDGYLVLIIGNNKVCNHEFNTQKYLTEYVESLGLKILFKLIDDIKSYGLMTKRNKTADIISREWILVFKK